MPLLTDAETRADRPQCSICNLVFLDSYAISIHRPCRPRDEAADKLKRYSKPDGIFAVRDGIVMLSTQVKAYETAQARRF